jgi:hypothetical protein
MKVTISFNSYTQWTKVANFFHFLPNSYIFFHFPAFSLPRVPSLRRQGGPGLGFHPRFPLAGTGSDATDPAAAELSARAALSPGSSPVLPQLWVPPSTASGTKRPGQHIDYPREPPEIVYSGGDRPSSPRKQRVAVFRKPLNVKQL